MSIQPRAGVESAERIISSPAVAHLTLVHDVARGLTSALRKCWPRLSFDAETVALGAALHDMGKAVVREELSQPGDRHEALGEQLLLSRGVPAPIARFARTHAQVDREGLALEVASACGQAPWEVFLALDEVLERLARDAQ